MEHSFGSATVEGFVELDDYNLFVRRPGPPPDEATTVIMTIAGEPEIPHDYLAPLSELANKTTCVFFYDSFGVGQSDTPTSGDFDRYRADFFVAELDLLRQKLDVNTSPVPSSPSNNGRRPMSAGNTWTKQSSRSCSSPVPGSRSWRRCSSSAWHR